MRVRENGRHRQRSRVRDMYRDIEGTGDLNGTHGVGSMISSVLVQKRGHNLKCTHGVFLKIKNM